MLFKKKKEDVQSVTLRDVLLKSYANVELVTEVTGDYILKIKAKENRLLVV